MRFRLFVPPSHHRASMLPHCRLSPLLLTLLCLCALLSACRSPVLMWNDDGVTMTDLRTLRHKARQSVELTRGVRLHADEIRYTDKRKRSGEAVGHVLLDIDPAVRYEWMLEHGYAGKAFFDKKQDFVVLADKPILEREFMTQIGTEPYSTIEVRWDSWQAEVILHGPSRTDFAKSHPQPPGIVLPKVSLPPGPAHRTLPQRGFSKR